MNYQPTIVVDFDGTIAQDANYPLLGEPMPRVRAALFLLKAIGYKVRIYSCRLNGSRAQNPDEWWVEHERLSGYLKDHGIPYDDFVLPSEGKPFADFYVDDKGVRFTSWDDVLKEVGNRRCASVTFGDDFNKIEAIRIANKINGLLWQQPEMLGWSVVSPVFTELDEVQDDGLFDYCQGTYGDFLFEAGVGAALTMHHILDASGEWGGDGRDNAFLMQLVCDLIDLTPVWWRLDGAEPVLSGDLAANCRELMLLNDHLANHDGTLWTIARLSYGKVMLSGEWVEQDRMMFVVPAQDEDQALSRAQDWWDDLVNQELHPPPNPEDKVTWTIIARR